MKAFMIIFDSMVHTPKTERVEFIQATHEYLAKNGFCSVNHGEFLFWSIDVLVDYTNNCDLCKLTDELEEVQTQSENNTENSNNDDTEASSSLVETKKARPKSKSKKSNSNSQTGGKHSSYCHTCDEQTTELLEQTFFCCFGYRIKGVKYLKNHSVINVKYTLDNCASLYEYYKPDLPEYDDLPFKSIPAEVRQQIKRIWQSEIKNQILILIIKVIVFLGEKTGSTKIRNR